LFAKRKDADTQRLAKKLAIQFHQQNYTTFMGLKFAKFTTKSSDFQKQKNTDEKVGQKCLAHMLVKSAPGNPDKELGNCTCGCRDINGKDVFNWMSV